MESLGLFCAGMFIPFLTLLAIVLLIGGGVGTIANKKNKGVRSFFLVVLVIGLSLTIRVGTLYLPEHFWDNLKPSYKVGEEKIKPYNQAINEVDRSSIGFSEINGDTEIRILKPNEDSFVACPDIELYINELPIRTHHICIKVNGNVNEWHSEYEIYKGPNDWESIWIAYSSEAGVMNQLGNPNEDSKPYTLVIEYWGSSDIRLENRNLTLEYIQPFLIEWSQYHKTEK